MEMYLAELKLNGCKGINQLIDLKFCNSTIKKNTNFKFTNIKAIYGPNGAGKSAIITAMYIYKNLICGQNGLNDSLFANFVKETINKQLKYLEIEATIIFSNENNSYLDTFRHYIRLALEKGDVKINSEKVSYLSGRLINDEYFNDLININNGKIKFILENDSIQKNKIINQTMNLLDKSSIVGTTFFKKNLGYVAHGIFSRINYALVLLHFFAVNLIVSIEQDDLHSNYFIGKEYNKMLENSKEKILQRVLEYIKNDDYIFNFSIEERDIVQRKRWDAYIDNINQLCEFIKIFKPSLDYIEIEKKINGDNYYCSKIFHYGREAIDVEFESTGIKKLVRLFNTLFSCTNGKIAFIDEFDANLHDVYFAKLIKFMKVYAKGQLCFTTHNLEPIEVLKDNAHALDFLSNDSRIATWTKNGNHSPMKKYVNGLIDFSPFNVDAIDFINALLRE